MTSRKLFPPMFPGMAEESEHLNTVRKEVQYRTHYPESLESKAFQTMGFSGFWIP
jgi:hypothetical protein